MHKCKLGIGMQEILVQHDFSPFYDRMQDLVYILNSGKIFCCELYKITSGLVSWDKGGLAYNPHLVFKGPVWSGF